MMTHTPIHELTDDGAHHDSHLYPVDSAVRDGQRRSGGSGSAPAGPGWAGVGEVSGRDTRVDVGPATPPPAWCLPGAEPDVCILGTEEPSGGWTVGQSRGLARRLTVAADLIDQGMAK